MNSSILGGLGNYSGSAVPDLGLGGQLNQQVQDETEEERKKRLRLQQQQGITTGTNTGAGSALNSLAATNIFGGSGAYGR